MTEQPSPRTRARFLAPFVTLTCAHCGRVFHRRRSKDRRLPKAPACGKRCRRVLGWNASRAGGTSLGTTMRRGERLYVYVGVGVPGADVRGYIPRARFVAAKELGRPLAPNERVLHLDGDKQNDAPENLAVYVVAVAPASD